MLTHFDENGKSIIVDVSEKQDTKRVAVATGTVCMSEATLRTVLSGDIKKGDVLNIARTAGIMASKKTSELIPLCQPIFISSCTIDFEVDQENSSVLITAKVKTEGKTGVEMEALTAVSVTALTIYDMCKAMDKEMVIKDICLMEKLGGKSGHFLRGGL